MKVNVTFENLLGSLLSDNFKKKCEIFILNIAIFSFLIHLTLIYLVHFEIIILEKVPELLKNPIVAIYTPFSFILVYEVYLLIYYLPKSISIYIRKQYEIITLIIIRRLFKDLSTIELSNDWFKIKYDLQFTYDIIASLVLFYLIYLFLKNSKVQEIGSEKDPFQIKALDRFIKLKKILASLLIVVIVLVAIYAFQKWVLGLFHPTDETALDFKNINNVFFEQFFTILIFVDVILLLFSFFHTDEFHKVIRNSGFVISTILIRSSFSVTGLINNILIISAITFGLLILITHNKFEGYFESNKIKK
jgi:hypothetical protein